MNKNLIAVAIIFLLVGAISSYFMLKTTNSTQINNEIAHNETVYIISEIPPKIAYLHYQKIILILNKSYNFSKEYVQDFNGTIPSPSNLTLNNTKTFYDNITINNVKFGYYTIKIMVHETVYAGNGHNHTMNYTILDKIYLGNNTIIWT